MHREEQCSSRFYTTEFHFNYLKINCPKVFKMEQTFYCVAYEVGC